MTRHISWIWLIQALIVMLVGNDILPVWTLFFPSLCWAVPTIGGLLLLIAMVLNKVILKLDTFDGLEEAIKRDNLENKSSLPLFLSIIIAFNLIVAYSITLVGPYVQIWFLIEYVLSMFFYNVMFLFTRIK